MIGTYSNISKLYKQYLKGEITLEEFRKAKIISYSAYISNNKLYNLLDKILDKIFK